MSIQCLVVEHHLEHYTTPLLCYMYHVFLQYEEGELYDNFRDFYNDVWPEFSKAGRIVQFKVCLANTFVDTINSNK